MHIHTTNQEELDRAFDEEKEFSESLLNAAKDTIFVFDLETGQPLRWNKNFTTISGYSDTEIAKMKAPDDFYTPEDQKRAHASLSQLPEQGKAMVDIELITKSGQKIPFEYSVTNIKDNNGKNLLLSIGRDISERKRSEEEIRNNEVMFRTAFNQSFQFMAIMDTSGKVLHINDLVYYVCGNRPEDIIGKYIWDAWWWNFEDQANINLKSIIKKAAKGQLTCDETTFFDKDGNSHHVTRTVSPVKDDAGKIIYIAIRGQDITEQKNAEGNLLESEKRYRELFTTMLDGFALHEMIFDKENQPQNYRFIEVNPAFEKMTGLVAEEIIGKTVLEVLTETEKYWIQTYGEVVLTGNARRFENYSNELKKYFEVFAYAVGENKFVTIISDITERKQAEEELKKNQQLLKSAQELGHIGSWRLDVEKNELIWSDENYRIFGVPVGTKKLTYETFLSCVHPDDRDYVDRKWQAAVNGEPYDIEHRLLVNGQTKWVRAKAELSFDQKGNIILATGFTQDITVRKQSELEREGMLGLLQLVNASSNLDMLLQSVLGFLKNFSGCEAIGIRLKQGDDFPYFQTTGFSDEFVLLENHLCNYDQNGKIKKDEDGNPILECMCGNILCGRFDPQKSFFTTDGCFWSNCTTDLLATTTDADRQARTRNRCNGVGYESVALIPIRSGDKTFGLLQFNDKRKGLFTPDLIKIYRWMADSIANFLAKNQAEEELLKYKIHLEELVDEKTRDLQRTVNLMAGREIRMKELKDIINILKQQLKNAGIEPKSEN